MKLSIIIPYYNQKEYTDELLACLDRQINPLGDEITANPDVEVILVDDGSKIPYKTDYPWCRVIRQRNGGASKARNKGLDEAKGDYIAFIDSDDLVADDYIVKLLDKMTENFDYCYLSWKTLPGGWNCEVKLNNIDDKFPPFNLCVWNRVYKRSMIGKIRFNPKKLIAEDAQFIREVKEEGKKKAFISDFMYFYRSSTQDSLTKRFSDGKLETKRVVYNIKQITKDRTDLLDEIIETDKDAEVIVQTSKCEIPEIRDYAMIMPYCSTMKGTELRGDPYPGFTKIELPIHTQIVIWTAVTMRIGGIETWIYNYCSNMAKYYDIIVLYKQIDGQQLSRLEKIVKCLKYEGQRITCDNLIINRITDDIPPSITPYKVIQMVHACKMIQSWAIPDNRDEIITVSDVVRDSFKVKSKTIHNLTVPPTDKECLILISATRLNKVSAFEKGHSRMIKLAEMLNDADIPFIWWMFSDCPLKDAPANVITMKPTLNIAPYIKKADYYVSLSDAEGYGYSMVEALINGTALITTPIGVLPEIGFIEGINGYTVPFNMDFDVKKLLKVPKDFEYKHDNKEIIAKWRSILGNKKPKHDYKPPEYVSIRSTRDYKDVMLNRLVKRGEVIKVSKDRAETLIKADYGRVYEV